MITCVSPAHLPMLILDVQVRTRLLSYFDVCYNLGEQQKRLRWWKIWPFTWFCSKAPACFSSQASCGSTETVSKWSWLGRAVGKVSTGMLLPSRVIALKQSQRQDLTWHPALLCWQTRVSSRCAQSWKKQLISALFEKTKDFLII